MNYALLIQYYTGSSVCVIFWSPIFGSSWLIASKAHLQASSSPLWHKGTLKIALRNQLGIPGFHKMGAHLGVLVVNIMFIVLGPCRGPLLMEALGSIY